MSMQYRHTHAVSAGWDDVGDFSSLADLLPAETNQPRILGDSNLGQSNSCLSIAIVLTKWIMNSSH